MSSYPGDVGGDKAISRLLLYHKAKNIPVRGCAVTLAGTSPENEIVLMRDYLRWPARKTWFVDKSKTPEITKSLKKIKGLWPEVNVSNEDIRNVIPKLGQIGFINLDLMGFPLSDTSVSCIKSLSKVLLPGAIFGLTWIRGRERLLHKSTRMLWRLGEGHHGNDRRWVGLEKAVSMLSEESLRLTDRWQYFNNHSPMCVAVFRKG